jgi:hypothetical protein
MFRITEDPSSGSLLQYLAKNYKNDSIVSVDMGKVGGWMMDPLWSETCWSTFKYFIILIVTKYYILCISWIIRCLIIIDARCKHEDSPTNVYNNFIQGRLHWRQCTRYLLATKRMNSEYTISYVFRFVTQK